MKPIRITLLSAICLFLLTGCLNGKEPDRITASGNTGTGRAGEVVTGDNEEEEDSHFKFAIHTGNGKCMWIVMDAGPGLDGTQIHKENEITISVYDDVRRTVLRQEIHSVSVDDYYKDVVVEDVDFDGNPDFYWPVEKGENSKNCFWLWDDAGEEFVADYYGLGDIVSPVFDVRTRTIQGRVGYGEDAEIRTFYSYSNNGLNPERMVAFHIPDYGANEQTITVEDYAGGQLYIARTSLAEESAAETRAGISKWLNMAYRLDSCWLEAAPEPGQEWDDCPQPGFWTAIKTLKAFEERDYQQLSGCAHPEKGITFVPYSSVDFDENLTFSSAQIAKFGTDTQQYAWGCYDQSPELIKLTVSGYFDHYVNDKDYLNTRQIGMNAIIRQGNSGENVREIYPGGFFVDFHDPGTAGYDGLDWSSLKIVMEVYEGEYKVVAVIHSEYTI